MPTYLVLQAEKNGKLPMTGRELFNYQDLIFIVPKTYDKDLDKELKKRYKISLAKWIKDTKYMGEHYWPALKSEHEPINCFIKKYARSRGVYRPADYINHFYSLLKTCVKKGKISRRKNKDGLWEYTGVT